MNGVQIYNKGELEEKRLVQSNESELLRAFREEKRKKNQRNGRREEFSIIIVERSWNFSSYNFFQSYRSVFSTLAIAI